MNRLRVPRHGFTALLVVAFSVVAFAETFNAFGPEDFVRSSGKPTDVIRTFTVANPNSSYTLRIDNGGLNGKFRRVSSGVITLNGIEVVRPNDFNQNVAVILTSRKVDIIEIVEQPRG
jgi:hypothetical protein